MKILYLLFLPLHIFLWVNTAYSQVQEVSHKKQAFREALLKIKSYSKSIDNNHAYREMYEDFREEGIKIMEELHKHPQTPPAAFCYISYRLYKDYLHSRDIQKLENLEKVLLDSYLSANDSQKKEIFDVLVIRNSVIHSIGVLTQRRSFFQEKEALELLKNEALRLEVPEWLINYYTDMGNLYKRIADYDKAIGMHLQALKTLDSLHIQNYNKYAEVEYHLGQLHYESKNYQKAITHWKKSLQITQKHNVVTRYKTLVTNNIGISYKALKKYDSAMVYLEKTIQEATFLKDSVWIGIATGNIGDIWVLQKEYRKAIPLLEKDVYLSLKFLEQNNAVNSLAQIGFCYIGLKEYSKALQYFKQALQLYNDFEYLMIENEGIGRFERLLPIYEGISKIYFEQKDFQKAYEYQSQFRALQDTLQKRSFSEQISLMEERYENELQENEKMLLQARIHNEKMQKWIAIVSIIALITFIFGLLAFFRSKVEKINSEKAKIEADKQLEIEKNLRLEEEMKAENEINNLKKQQYEEEIATKERELTTASLLMYQKNEALQKLQEQIQSITKETTDKDAQKSLKNTISQIKNEINLEKDWDLFKKQFEQVYPKFFVELTSKYPELNLTDLRLCAYMRMNLDNRVIAQFLGISPDSLRVARHRLRKKIHIKDDKELYLILQSI